MKYGANLKNDNMLISFIEFHYTFAFNSIDTIKIIDLIVTTVLVIYISMYINKKFSNSRKTKDFIVEEIKDVFNIDLEQWKK